MARFSVSSATASRSDGAIAVTASVLDATPSLAARDLAHACGAEVAWVVQLVEIGIVERSPSEPVAGPEQWRFRGVDLRRALEARRLQRDFGVELDAAALILDLQHEVRRLKAALQAGQLGR
ncbi:MAG TPA: chaperone modulator CbpM [Variovorax sp.]|nr:chaperone modulator CbpM [Variovorax sp.]